MPKRKQRLEDAGIHRSRDVCGDHAEDSPPPRHCNWDNGLCFLDSSLKCGGYIEQMRARDLVPAPQKDRKPE